MRWSTLGLVGAAGVLGATSADAAETVHLYLKANGADIQGESTQTSLGRDGSIQCVQLDFGAKLSPSGAKLYDTIHCRKRIDKSSPLLFKAFAQQQATDGVLKFFRPNPRGDGTTEQFYTVQFKGGRIDSFKAYIPNAIEPASSNYPPQEDVTFTYRYISVTYTNGGIFAEDTVR